MAAFGIRNQKGSCWVNAALQSIFRIRDVQDRYTKDKADTNNPTEMCIQEIWNSEGDEGLKAFFECVKTATMPAGDGIGDSHELLEFLCDKIPFLDKMFRFKVANVIKCSNCPNSESKPDSLVEFSINPTYRKQSVSDCIVEAVKPIKIDDWLCSKCKNHGCTKQFLMGSFPRVLAFHMTSVNTSASYSSILAINGIKYALFAVICYNGGHWWTYGRNLPPPGQPWIEFDDLNVRRHGPQHFPISDQMRLLMYYRLNE
jgi:ubiquitin C-terminal hydrolase